MNEDTLVNGLLDFVKRSPTPFHAVENMVGMLQEAGFKRLSEKEQWQVDGEQAAAGYFVTRNDSSIIAFRLHRPLPEHGIHMIGAHTDSPCLKVKPNPDMSAQHYLQLGVEVYGGALLNPWFDRDLSLAGRVSYINGSGAVAHCLVDWKKAIAVIPSLAIHLDREANDSRSVNRQTDLPPVLMSLPESDDAPSPEFSNLLLDMVNKQLAAKGEGVQAEKILGYELSFYDVQAPAIVGLQDEFIASARLDNLLSCYVGLTALLNYQGRQNALLVCNDHEEVGSVSASGAQGNFLRSVLARLAGGDEASARMMASSMMISADNAHAVHPNYADRHEPNHGPLINGGPVIKVNANQRYASNSETGALFRHWCESAGVPVQSFVVRTDMGCGSTIGPITANNLGVRTVDVGVPSFAMHSIRELAGCRDVFYLYQVLQRYFA
ncbi:MAG: M18 family aminopeptidase [Mariprofundaceae bacterium]|nr:M18 family aminopeptidase [Mariprofundaceae bacterium]